MLKEEEEPTFLNAREAADLSDDAVCAKHNASLSLTSTCTHIILAVAPCLVLEMQGAPHS